MIEVLKQFLLFGIIEVIILLLFYKYIGMFKNIKMWHGLILSPIIIFFSLFKIPFVKQSTMILLLIIYLLIITKYNILVILKIVLFSFIYLLILEVFFSILLDFALNIDLSKINDVIKFIVFIPIRFSQLIIIYIVRNNTWDLSGLEKSKNTKKKLKKLNS